MDHKKSSPMRRTKRQAKAALEDNFWDCSVCTYRNNAEAFKCLMCDVRKGTSTRKPRINPQLAAQQVASQFLPAATSAHLAAPIGGRHHHARGLGKDKRALKKRRHPARLKNVDRSTAQTREVTVNSVTVVITEYKPKAAKGPQDAAAAANTSSSSSETLSESSMDAR